MKGKIISFSLLACLVIAVFALPGNVYGATKFSDVSGHWAEKYINEAVAQGVVKGYPDGKFLPDSPVTRAEFATIINKALGNSGTSPISFYDVPRTEWYYSEISKAVAATYVAGYSDNSYKPNNSITRQEAAVMISRIVPTYGHSGKLTSYNDYKLVDEWAYAALQKVNGKGYIGGYTDGGIHPQDKLTRAQTAKIICDILDGETIVKSSTTVKTDGTKLSGKIYSNGVTIHSSLDDGSVTIDNSIVLGTLAIQGGGVDTVTINNARVSSAVVDKDDSPVRILVKGETVVSQLTASQESLLQTSSLTGGFYGSGFNNISLRGSAKATLKGSFPLVTIDGSSANLILESGNISELTVNSAGRKSTITASSGTTISNATVGGEASFRGTGTISHMAVNANGVTYETKPKNWTVASRIDAPTQVDPALEITFSPKHTATKIAVDTKITLTFSSAMKNYDGSTIKNTDIPDFITLRRSSSSGTSVKFSAAIDSAKKVITLTPESKLDENTRYYVIVDKNSMKDAKGNGNAAQSIYFTTSDANLGTTYSPSEGATGVSLNPSITIKFSDSVVRYSNGATISSSDSYLKECVTFKEGSASGTNVAFEATINSSKNTITIKPTKELTLNKKYYVGVVANKLKTSGGTAMPASSVSWSTGYTAPVLSNFTLVPGDINIVAKMTPNVSGKIYAIVLPSGSAAPSATQIAAGQDSKGFAAAAFVKNENVAANALITLPAMSGLASGTNYDVWTTLYSSASATYSTPIKASTTTTLPKIYLSGLTVGPVDGGNYIQFNSTTDTYDVSIPSNIRKVRIAAISSEGGIITIGGASTASRDFDMNGNITVKIEVSLTNRGTTTYTLNLNQVQNTGIESVKINGASLSSVGSDSYRYTLTTNAAVSLGLNIVTIDKNAVIGTPLGAGVIVSGSSSAGVGNYTLDIGEGYAPIAISLTISSGPSQSTTYTITFTRPGPPPVPEQIPPADANTGTTPPEGSVE